MGLKVTEFEDYVHAWVTAAVNVPVVWANETVVDNDADAPALGGTPPRPARTYITLDTQTIRRAGRGSNLPVVELTPEVGSTPATYDQPVKLTYEATVQIQGYGPESGDEVLLVENAMIVGEGRDELLRQCIVPAMQLNEVSLFKTRLNSTEWERRAVFDIMFRTPTIVSNGGDVIEVVKLDGTVRTGGNVAHQIAKTISKD
jgi:hypothetical protein